MELYWRVRRACHCAPLMLGALDRNAMHARGQHSFSDCRCAVLLPLDERLHINRRDSSDIVSEALSEAPPIMPGRAGLHRDDARRLCA